MILNKIATILRESGNLKCLEKAEFLEKDKFQTSTLNLRDLDLKANDIVAIADLLEKETSGSSIYSISFSYNRHIGDRGATRIAKSLPHSITEIGMVDCGIGDQGGTAILNWIKKTSNLRMICIEQNSFSEKLKQEFKAFKDKNPLVMVVV